MDHKGIFINRIIPLFIIMTEEILKSKVDITPDKSLIKKLGSTGYRIFQAIGELTDNSIDAKMLNKKLDIQITLGYTKKMICISDNAKGMNGKILGEALTLAKSSKTNEELGKFGLGLKTACSSLGQKFTIITKTSESPKEFIATYDEKQWLNEKTKNNSRWKIFIEERPAKEIKESGTIIKIERLNVKLYPTQTYKATEYFGKRYAPLIEKKLLNIHINSRPCLAILPVLKYKEPFEALLPSGNKINGWIGLKKVGSIVGDYGFNLYNQGRLISFNDKSFIPQHPTVARVVGDLNLDFVPTNFSKTEFILDSPEYFEVKRILPENKQIRDILQEARKNKYSAEISDQIREKLYSEVKTTFDLIPKIETDFSFESTTNVIPDQLIISESVYYNGEKYNIKVYLVGKDECKTFFITKYEDQIKIDININSPFFFSFKSKTLPINIVLADALSTIFNFKDQSDRQYFKDKLISASLNTIKEDKTKEDLTDKIKSHTLQDNSWLLSENLLNLYERLVEKFGNSFYFTGTSVLEGYQNNLPAIQYYFVYCDLGQINSIAKEIKQLNDTLLVLQNPKKEEIILTIKNTGHNKVIILREKQRDIAELREGSVASIETAFVDLYFEIKHEHVPIVESEIHEIFENIISTGEGNINKIRRRAIKRKVKEKLEEILGRIL